MTLGAEAAVAVPTTPLSMSKTLVLPAAIFQRSQSFSQMASPANARTPSGTGASEVQKLLATLDESTRLAAWIRESFGDSHATEANKAAAAAACCRAGETGPRGTPTAAARQAWGPMPPQADHVWFNSPLNSAVEITPYSQIYGIHPRFFNFDEDGSMQPSACADPWRQGPGTPVTACQSPCASPVVWSSGANFFMPASGLLPSSPVMAPTATAPPVFRRHASPMLQKPGGPAMTAMLAGVPGPCRARAGGTPHARLAPSGFGSVPGPDVTSCSVALPAPQNAGSVRFQLPSQDSRNAPQFLRC